jgi:maleylacetate reductase
VTVAYSLPSVRVVAGTGAVRDLRPELERLGLGRVVLISTPGRSGERDRIAAALGPLVVATCARAAAHVPAELVESVVAEVAPAGPDGCVTIGGGSATGLGKAIALRTSLPLVSVPTTYAGSEMTSIWGITQNGAKHTGRDAKAAPVLVVYDPELTVSLSPEASSASGMNAAAHAVEALYAPDANPLTSLLAERALQLLSDVLPRVQATPGDLAAREQAFVAAHFAGLALNGTTMGLHHALCHALGGVASLPHALTHAVVLPYATAFNQRSAVDAMTIVASALHDTDAAAGQLHLRQRLGLPASLRALGLAEYQLEQAAAMVAAKNITHPRTVLLDDARRVLRAAYEGTTSMADLGS